MCVRTYNFAARERPPKPTFLKQNEKKKRCLGLEVPHRALVVAARMLQHALSIQDEGETKQPLPTAAAAAAATAAPGAIVELTSPGKSAKNVGPAAIGGGGKVGDDRWKKRKDLRGPPPPPVSREEFGRIVGLCLLPYSLTWTDAIYGVCLGEGGVEGEEGAATSGADSGKAKKKGKVTKVRFARYVNAVGYPGLTYLPGYNLLGYIRTRGYSGMTYPGKLFPGSLCLCYRPSMPYPS